MGSSVPLPEKSRDGPWAGLLMRDIEAAKTVVFFAPVGTIGKAFLEIESAAFSMDGTG